MDDAFCKLLAEGAGKMGVFLPDAAVATLGRFQVLLLEANRAMNLTRVPDDPREAVWRNYLDSLSPLCVPGLLDGAQTLADAGTGAGFPGLPLAVARPDLQVTLIDSLGKRVKFLEDAARTLGITNVRCVHARAEDAGRVPSLRDAFDAVTARALAPLNVLTELALPLVKPGGVLLAYKGPGLDEELPQAQNALVKLGGRVREVFPVAFPDCDWDHRLLAIEKTGKTPAAYPRKAGEPGRKPL